MRKQRLEREKFFRFSKLIVVIFVACLLFFLMSKLGHKPLVSPISSSILSSKLPVDDTNTKSFLGDAVIDVLRNTQGSYAVVIDNLKTGESYSFNEHKVFESGSLYKLWVMGKVFENIKEGKLTESDVLSEEIPVLNEKFYIASEEAELTEGKVTLPVNLALKQMITISDNYSALLLTEKIGLSKVAAFLQAHGFTESQVGTHGEAPTTTAYDIALFFERLYKGQLADELSSREMIDLLKSQQFDNKIPKYLPKGTIIADKTGELGFITHDAGIVYSPKSDYIIVVLSETDKPADAEEKIAQISKAVFDYFKNK